MHLAVFKQRKGRHYLRFFLVSFRRIIMQKVGTHKRLFETEGLTGIYFGSGSFRPKNICPLADPEVKGV